MAGSFQQPSHGKRHNLEKQGDKSLQICRGPSVCEGCRREMCNKMYKFSILSISGEKNSPANIQPAHLQGVVGGEADGEAAGKEGGEGVAVVVQEERVVGERGHAEPDLRGGEERGPRGNEGRWVQREGGVREQGHAEPDLCGARKGIVGYWRERSSERGRC